VLAQYMVGNQLHRPRLERSERRSEQRQDRNENEPAAMWMEARPKQKPQAREGTPPLRCFQRLT